MKIIPKQIKKFQPGLRANCSLSLNPEPDCTLHSEGLFLPTSLINILFLTVLLNGCCSWAAQHRFSARHGGGGVNYAERWREARQPLWWTVSFKHGPLPAVLQLQGSPVGLGVQPNWGLVEMTDSARNESQFILQYPKLDKEGGNAIKVHKNYTKGSKRNFFLLFFYFLTFRLLEIQSLKWIFEPKNFSPVKAPWPKRKYKKFSWTFPIPSLGYHNPNYLNKV